MEGRERQHAKETGEVSMIENLTACLGLYHSRFGTKETLGLCCLLYGLYVHPLVSKLFTSLFQDLIKIRCSNLLLEEKCHFNYQHSLPEEEC